MAPATSVRAEDPKCWVKERVSKGDRKEGSDTWPPRAGEWEATEGATDSGTAVES